MKKRKRHTVEHKSVLLSKNDLTGPFPDLKDYLFSLHKFWIYKFDKLKFPYNWGKFGAKGITNIGPFLVIYRDMFTNNNDVVL